MVIAAVVVIGAVAGIVLATAGGKKGPPPPSSSSDGTPTQTPATAPKGPDKPPPPPPYPPMDVNKILEIKAKVKSFEPQIARGQQLYDEAIKLKNEKKDEEWQAKLKEASLEFEAVQDEWNAILESLPTSTHYDMEDVANHYLGQEGAKVAKAMQTIMAIKKQRRLSGG
jgi:hypothetical protein